MLIDWDPAYVLDPSAVVALDIDGVQRELDLGRPVEDVRRQWLADHPDRAVDVDHYFDEWDRTVAGPIDAAVAVLAELRDRGLQLYALSNFSGVLFRRVRPRFPFLEWFDGLVISGDEGVIKPDPAIYALLIDRYGLDPRRTVFVDDRVENVEGARDAGMLAVQFTAAPDLRTDLQHHGVLTAD